MSKSGSNKQAIPSKKTLNLMMKDKSASSSTLTILLAVFLAIIVFCVFKFGVFDRMYAIYSANAEARRAESELEDVKKQTADYDELYNLYARYSTAYFNDTELMRVDRLKAINLVDSLILSTGYSQSYVLNENVISLNLSGVTLTQVSDLLKRLYSNDMVENVEVYTANTGDGVATTVNMTVTLVKAGD